MKLRLKKAIYACIFILIFYFLFINNNVGNFIFNDFDETEVFEFNTGSDMQEALKKMGMSFRVYGYINGEAELFVYKGAHLDRPEPDHRVKLSGATFTASLMEFSSFNGPVYIKIRPSDSDLSGVIYVAAYY